MLPGISGVTFGCIIGLHGIAALLWPLATEMNRSSWNRQQRYELALEMTVGVSLCIHNTIV